MTKQNEQSGISFGIIIYHFKLIFFALSYFFYTTFNLKGFSGTKLKIIFEIFAYSYIK